MTYSRNRGRSSTPKMPPTVPAAAPMVPPTIAPRGPAALSPAAAPSWAPRTVPCAYAANGKLTSMKAATGRHFIFMITPFLCDHLATKITQPNVTAPTQNAACCHTFHRSQRIADPRVEQLKQIYEGKTRFSAGNWFNKFVSCGPPHDVVTKYHKSCARG